MTELTLACHFIVLLQLNIFIFSLSTRMPLAKKIDWVSSMLFRFLRLMRDYLLHARAGRLLLSIRYQPRVVLTTAFIYICMILDFHFDCSFYTSLRGYATYP